MKLYRTNKMWNEEYAYFQKKKTLEKARKLIHSVMPAESSAFEVILSHQKKVDAKTA